MLISMLILFTFSYMTYNPASAIWQTTPANLNRMCPYNDFCYLSATKTIKQSDEDPCCRPCTCDEDCWKFGTCCPDKEGPQREPAWPCKGTGGTRSYYVTDRCPDEEHRVALLDKCSKQNMTNFEDIIWVSDTVTGLIYQNQFCADCHGVKNVLPWHARLNCLKVWGNQTDTVNLDAMRQNPNCKIIMEIPQSLATQTEPYQCFIPQYNRCNESGLWEQTNQTIETACNAFSMPFFFKLGKAFEIYRNVYCFVCNIRQINMNTLPNILDKTCLLGADGRTKDSFSMYIDFKRYFMTEGAKLTYRCGDSEIFDPYLNVCHRMRCPFGSRSSKGICEKFIIETEGLAIGIIYRVQTFYSNLTVSTINKIGLALFEELRQFLAFNDGQCKVCSQELRMLEINRSLLLADYLMFIQVRTDTNCSYESIIAKLMGFMGRKITVYTGQFESLVFVLKLAVMDFEDFQTATFITSRDSNALCYLSYVITSEKMCAKMQLSNKMLQNSPALKHKEVLLAKILNASTPIENESYVDICTDDYFSLMSQVNQAPFLQCYLPMLMVIVVARQLYND